MSLKSSLDALVLFEVYLPLVGRQVLAGREGPREIIRDALARALFDADQRIFDALGGTRQAEGVSELARRIVNELAHAGYYLASARDCPPGASDAQRRLTLEDHIRFGIEMTARTWREQVGSSDRAAAGSARAGMTEKICETLTLMRVTLRRRRRPP